MLFEELVAEPSATSVASVNQYLHAGRASSPQPGAARRSPYSPSAATSPRLGTARYSAANAFELALQAHRRDDAESVISPVEEDEVVEAVEASRGSSGGSFRFGSPLVEEGGAGSPSRLPAVAVTGDGDDDDDDGDAAGADYTPVDSAAEEEQEEKKEEKEERRHSPTHSRRSSGAESGAERHARRRASRNVRVEYLPPADPVSIAGVARFKRISSKPPLSVRQYSGLRTGRVALHTAATLIAHSVVPPSTLDGKSCGGNAKGGS